VISVFIDFITKQEFQISYPRRFLGRGWVGYNTYKNKSLYVTGTYEPEKFEDRYKELRRKPKIFMYRDGNNVTKFIRVISRKINTYGRLKIKFEMVDNLSIAEYIDDNRKWIDAEKKRHSLQKRIDL